MATKNVTSNTGAVNSTLISDLTIGGTLSLTSGKIVTAANKVILRQLVALSDILLADADIRM